MVWMGSLWKSIPKSIRAIFCQGSIPSPRFSYNALMIFLMLIVMLVSIMMIPVFTLKCNWAFDLW